MHLPHRFMALALSITTASCLIPAQNVFAATASDYVDKAVAIAEDDTYGYSTTDRWGPDYDCSSFVITALQQAGFNTADASCSSDMIEELTTVGFTYISSSDVDMSVGSTELLAGDILMASGHVEIYIGSSQRVGAHRDYDGVSGDSTGKEISIEPYYRGDWYGILRYTGSSGATTATTTATTTASAGSETAAATQTVKTTSTSKKYKKGTYKTKCALNVRKGASTSKKVKFVVKKGTKVKVTKVKNGWGKIKYKGKTGWVCLSYCKRVK